MNSSKKNENWKNKNQDKILSRITFNVKILKYGYENNESQSKDHRRRFKSKD